MSDENKTGKKIYLNLENGDTYTVDVHEIASNRANYYEKADPDTTYKEEYEFLLEEDYEVYDWLFNNMNWFSCKTLKLYEHSRKQLSDMEIADYTIK